MPRRASTKWNLHALFLIRSNTCTLQRYLIMEEAGWGLEGYLRTHMEHAKRKFPK